MSHPLRIVECPRDAMQGLNDFVPTEVKINYLNSLLKVGFDTLDFGSFVSPKAIPQLRDTAEVLQSLEDSPTKLLAIVANERGAEDALIHKRIKYLGFPLSISETFQQRNTNKSIEEALEVVRSIQTRCAENSRELVVYLSMGFGNPYNDPYNPSIISKFIQILEEMGVAIISIADTIGVATPESIHEILSATLKQFPHIEIGAHLHSTPTAVYNVVDAALNSGVRRIDGALLGYGGCPMAEDELVGNVATEQIIMQAEDRNIDISVDHGALNEARQTASNLFGTYR